MKQPGIIQLVLLSLLCNPSEASRNDRCKVASAFKKSRIVPEVVETAPDNLLNVFYSSGTQVELGNTLDASDTGNQFNSINVQLTCSVGGFGNGLFTLTMFDPDAPKGFQDNPDGLGVLHYLSFNIPGEKLESGLDVFETLDLNKGNVTESYIAPAPPEGTGPHRYCFVLFKQRSYIRDPKPVEDRMKFSLKNYIKGERLINPKPFGGNYFLQAPESE